MVSVSSHIVIKRVKLNSSLIFLQKSKNLLRGFTLIEVLLVLSIIMIISVAGVVGYTSINKRQQLNNAAQDFLVLLHTAKSQAQSQIAPSSCTTLSSYQIIRCGGSGSTPPCINSISPTTYELQASCSNGNKFVDSKSLPPDVVFDDTDSSSLQYVTFQLVSGGVSKGTITIKNGTDTRVLTIGQYGKITLTN